VVPWNFSKFLLNSQGEVVRFFDPYDDLEEIQVEVEALL
jgi:glutathione peroxidase